MNEPIISFDHNVHECQAHNLAHPVTVTIPGKTPLGQPVFLLRSVGGLTKLEAGALQIAAAAVIGQSNIQHTAQELASIAANVATAVLDECRARQQAQEAEVVAAREAATRRNGHGAGDEVGKGRILTP